MGEEVGGKEIEVAHVMAPRPRPTSTLVARYPYAIAANGALEPVQRCFPDMEELNSTIIGAPQATVPGHPVAWPPLPLFAFVC